MIVSTEFSLQTIVKNFSSLIVFGGFTAGAFILTHEITRYVLEETRLGLFLLHRFLSMLLFVFFLSINVGNIIVSYATLYRSKETNFLLTKPISHTTLFIIKFLDNFFYSSTTLLLIALASFAGYGTYFGVSWSFYVIAITLLFMPYMLLAASIGVIMLMLLMKLAEKFGVKVVMGAIVVGYVAAVYGYFKIINPMLLVNNVMKYFPHVDQYFGFLDPPFVHYLPNYWFAEALYWGIRGNALESMASIGVLLCVAGVFVVIMILLARKLFYSTWLISMELRAKSKMLQTAQGVLSLTKKSVVDSQINALTKKEFWHFFREPSQWIHFCIILVLVLIFVGSISRIDFQLGRPFLDTVSYLVVYIFNAFLIASVALRFVYPMISIEGQSFWKVRSSPTSLNKVFWLKFLLATVPIIVLGEILSYASHRSFAEYFSLQIYASISVVFITMTFVGMNLGAGSFFANYSETNPIRVASSQGATMTFLLCMMFLVFLVAVLFFPLNDFFTSVSRRQVFDERVMVSALAAIGIVSLILTLVCTMGGLRTIKRDF